MRRQDRGVHAGNRIWMNIDVYSYRRGLDLRSDRAVSSCR